MAQKAAGHLETITTRNHHLMKRSTYLLVGSLALNAVLLPVLVFSRHNGASKTQSASACPLNPGIDSNSTKPPAQTLTATNQGTGAKQKLWEALATDDFAELVKRLQASGFPPSAIRAILQERMTSHFANRRKQLLGSREDIPYWQSPYRPPEPRDAEQKAQLAALEREEQKADSKLFIGLTAYDDEEQLAQTRQRYGNLSPEKLQQLSAIRADYMEMQIELYSSTKPGQEPSAEIMQKNAALEKEERADIVKTLSPEELVEYDLHASPVATLLRSRLRDFRPTEAEYRALFAVISPLNNASDASAFSNFQQLKAQASSVLTPERYADFLQAMTWENDKLGRLVARLELPLATVGKVNAIRDDIVQRSKSVRADATLDPAARDTQLATLAEEAKSKLTSTLGGERGFQAYDDMKGDWLRALQPKPSATANP